MRWVGCGGEREGMVEDLSGVYGEEVWLEGRVGEIRRG